MRKVDEACIWLRWRMVCHPRPQPGTNELVSLALLQCRKRHTEVLLRLRVEPIQSGLIHLLPLHRRNPNQKIDELRRPGVFSARITPKRWHEDLTQPAQRRELLFIEEIGISLRHRIGNYRRYRQRFHFHQPTHPWHRSRCRRRSTRYSRWYRRRHLCPRLLS